MKLGVQVGLGPGHNVLDGDPAAPPQRDTAPNFGPISVVAIIQMNNYFISQHVFKVSATSTHTISDGRATGQSLRQ